MSRLLVHLHLYYFDQTEYFIKKLSNINNCDWSLYVSITRHNNAAEKKIYDAYPNATIMLVENRGADVWPFIQVLQKVDLSEYDFVLKLHSKSPNKDGLINNGIKYKDYQWRNALVDAILKNPDSFNKALRKLDESEKNGIVYNILFYRKVNRTMHEYLPLLEELKRLSLNPDDLHYAAGTMFLARSAPYKLLQTNKISANTFPKDFKTHSFGSITHIYEFICSLVVNSASLRTITIYNNLWQVLYIKVYIEKIEPLIESIFSIKYVLNTKTLTILGIRIPLKTKTNE